METKSKNILGPSMKKTWKSRLPRKFKYVGRGQDFRFLAYGKGWAKKAEVGVAKFSILPPLRISNGKAL